MTHPSATATRPLVTGDRLDRAEFHRRYLALPDLKKAELVEGIVYVPSPVRTDLHAIPDAAVHGWLIAYAAATPGVQVAANGTVLLGERSEVQPDALVRIDPDRGGRSRLTAEGYVAGPPELVVEIAASSASYDAQAKRDAYRRAGVREYLLWRTHDGAIDWWALEASGRRYIPLPTGDDGLVASRVLPGLALDVAAMLAGDLAAVLAAQNARHGAADHRAFVERLAR